MPSRRRPLAALLVLLTASGALTATASGAAPTPASEPAPHEAGAHCGCDQLSAEDAAFIDETVAGFMAETGLVGVTVSIEAPGLGRFERSYGEADRATGRELTPGDHYRIASVTKTFVANAVLQLVDDGALALEDTLDQYVEGVPNGDVITIRQLLAMRAGVFNYVDDETFMDAYTADPLLPWWAPEDIVPILQRHDPAYPPDERTVYSDSNYVLLGLVLEQVTGEPAEWWITREVIRPLGLENTSFPTSPALPDPYTHGYETGSDPLVDLTWSSPEVPWTAGAMVSTVPDMAVYAEQLATGALLSEELQEQRLDFADMGNAEGAFLGYGLGIAEIGEWIGHNGAVFGYGNIVTYLPSQDATIVVMGNSASTTEAPAVPLWGALVQHFFPESLTTS